MIFELFRIHYLKRFCDFYEVGKEIFCKVRHLEIPWKSWVTFFIHDEDRSRVVVFQSCCFVSVVVDSEKLHILGLRSDVFVCSSKSLTTVARF